MTKKPFFFGIDGGGTHSRIVLTDENGLSLARANAGSTNIYSVSKEEVYKNLSILLNSALKSANLQKQDITSGCIGSAGLGREEEKTLFRGFFNTLLSPDIPVLLCTDGEILLCGGLKNLEGYCLIAGTGSIAFGRTKNGKLVRAGGHGYLLGDEGSAAWIGRIAIARLLRSRENRDLPSKMEIAILETAGLSKTEELIRYVHKDADKARIAELAIVVSKAAKEGDPLALDILIKGAHELFMLVKSVIEQTPEIENKELVIAGGVMENDEITKKTLIEILSKEFSYLKVFPPKSTALEGACLLANQIYGQNN